MSIEVHKRVIKDIKDGIKNLKDEFGIYIAPEENNFYHVHFILPGPEDTPFEGGLYHGMIRLNDNHPYSAPNIHMITPNGRFVPEQYPIKNGSRGICTTATAFHPESWTPINNIETVMKGFISLMCDPYDGGIGGMKSTTEQMKKMAKESIDHLKLDSVVKNLFPDLYEKIIDGTFKSVKLVELSKTSKKEKNKQNITDLPIKKQIKLHKTKIETDYENDSDINYVPKHNKDTHKIQLKSKKSNKKKSNKKYIDCSESESDDNSDQEILKNEIKNMSLKSGKTNKKYIDCSESESDSDDNSDQEIQKNEIKNMSLKSNKIKKNNQKN